MILFILEYIIYIFGISIDNKPVTVKVKDFSPFFFIEIPSNWDHTCIYSVKEALGKNVKNIEFLKRKRYYSFERGDS